MDGTTPSEGEPKLAESLSAGTSSAVRSAVAETRRQLAPYARRTPLLAVRGSDLGLPLPIVALKLEQHQHAATFKARSAMAAILDGITMRGPRLRCVTTASKGNGGVAVAWAAMRLGLRARIFVPDGVPHAKIARIRGYGAEIALAPRGAERHIAAHRRWAEEAGALVVRSAERAALLGCASIASELDEQIQADSAIGALDTLIVPVGSGCLIAGLAIGDGRDGGDGRGMRLVGVEPLRAPTLGAALAAGAPVSISPSGIAADTLGATRVEDAVLAIVRRRVDRVVAVSDFALVEAQRVLWSELRIVVEPGGAAALAALQSGAYRPAAGERVGLLLTGANG